MGLFKKILVFLNFAYTVLVLNYSCVGFMVSPFLTYNVTSLVFLGSRTFCFQVSYAYFTKEISFLCLCACIGQVLSLHETIASYGSVYFIGTIVPIVLILLGYIIRPAKPVRSKARKEQ